ncbi:MAG: DUF1566 domain-containing protein [Treponema sp.]|nr:DUF1566 domain-containing protein [Treponema sp.]
MKKSFLIASAVAMALAFMGCSNGTDTEYVEVEKQVEKEKPVFVTATTEAASRIQYFKQDLPSLVNYMWQKDDGTWDDMDYENYYGYTMVAQDTEAKALPAGTKLGDIAKKYEGFTIAALATIKEADGKVTANVYYDRNIITYKFGDKELKGLYEASFTVPGEDTTSQYLVQWKSEGLNFGRATVGTSRQFGSKDAVFSAEWHSKSQAIGSQLDRTTVAVGDVIFADGTYAPSTAQLTDLQKNLAESVVFYKGTAADPLGARVLAVNVKKSSDSMWAKYNSTGVNTNFTDIQASYGGSAPSYTFTGDNDGSDNWDKICAADPAGSASDKAKENYPAFYFVNTETPGYYLPTLAELYEVYKNKAILNAAFEKLGVDKFEERSYWSSSQGISNSNNAWCVTFSNDDLYYGNKWYYSCVCSIRVFN